MSISYKSGVILGVKLNEIGLETKLHKSQYEIHDKKGKPTGKFDDEYHWTINFNGNLIIEEGKKLYSDVIEDIVDVKKPLNFFENSCDGFNIEDVIVGIEIISRNYNDYNLVKEILFSDKINLVKSELKNQFNVDIEPKLLYYYQVC